MIQNQNMNKRVRELYNTHHDKLFKDTVIELKFNKNKSRAAVCLKKKTKNKSNMCIYF